jgi:large subunit ribosomal protein L14
VVRKETRLVIADNSGAKEAKIIHVVGSTGKDIARVGDLVKIAVKKAIPGGQVKKGTVQTAVIVRTCKEVRREDASYVRFDDNAAVIVDKDNQPVGTRIFGPIARELRARGFSKIISLAPEVL